MRRCLLLGVAVAAWGWGCTDRAASDDGGGVWPDLALDSKATDLAPTDRGVDVSLPDGSGRDAALEPWQSVKVHQNPDLHAVACLASGDVFVAGDQGTLLHRGPGSPPGIVFTKQQVGDPTTTNDLYTVSFADAAYGAAAGKGWEIWETKDLGQTWAMAPQCSAFLFDAFHALHLDTSTSGFGAGIANNGQGGGYKYYGGYSWVCGPTPYAGEAFYDVVRLGKSGWIVGKTGGKIYATEDEGMAWTPVSAGTTATLHAVHFQSAALGLAVGEGGVIVRSTDGAGKVWSSVTSGVSTDLHDVTMVDATTGWAVGEGGTLLVTKDGGQSWSQQLSGVTERLEGVCFTSAKDGWVVGQAGVVLHTETGGS
jgi:photosystem II stability/assembly factor-like uncharacterized protein